MKPIISGGCADMNGLKPVLFALLLLTSPLCSVPSFAAAPDQFSLGKKVAEPKALPSTPVTQSEAAPSAGKAKPAPKAAAKPKGAQAAKKTATKTKARKSADVIATDIPAPKLDLTLPKDMVNQLQPPGKEPGAKPVVAAQPADGKPLLPSLFAPKEGGEPFQLNGRLLTNEMELQMRNENRREVEGAALDFKFKQ